MPKALSLRIIQLALGLWPYVLAAFVASNWAGPAMALDPNIPVSALGISYWSVDDDLPDQSVHIVFSLVAPLILPSLDNSPKDESPATRSVSIRRRQLNRSGCHHGMARRGNLTARIRCVADATRPRLPQAQR